MTEPSYGVVIDEVKINATRGSRWWATQRQRFEDTGRLRIIPMRDGRPAVCLVGQLVEIGPFDEDDAEFAREHIVSHGIHKAAVKVRRWTPEPGPWAKPRATAQAAAEGSGR
jgi:hypothetical protein